MASKDWLKAIKNSNAAALDDFQKAGEDVSIEGETLAGAHISKLKLQDLLCAKTEWENCILESIEFVDTDLSGAFFNACTLHDCIFDNTNLDDTAFEGCVMQGTQFKNIRANGLEIAHSQFKECELAGVNLEEANLTSLTFTGCKLNKISGNGELQSVILRGGEINEFNTDDFEVTHCNASGVVNPPKGFLRCEGKRRRV